MLTLPYLDRTRTLGHKSYVIIDWFVCVYINIRLVNVDTE